MVLKDKMYEELNKSKKFKDEIEKKIKNKRLKKLSDCKNKLNEI